MTTKTTSAPSTNPTKVVTGKVRFSYVNLFTPRAMKEGDEPKYSVTLLIPKHDVATVKKIKDAIAAVKADQKAITKWGGKVPANVPTTFKDADVDTNKSGDIIADVQPEAKGCYVISVSSKEAPSIVGPDKQPILNPAEVYSGCWGRASINFFAYNFSGSKGISAGLNNIQKLEDDESLSGRTSAEEDFKD